MRDRLAPYFRSMLSPGASHKQRPSACSYTLGPSPFFLARLACTRTNKQFARSSSSSSTQALKHNKADILLTLERSVGSNKVNSEANLRETQAFHAEVFPDLPAATTWGSMWRKMSE